MLIRWLFNLVVFETRSFANVLCANRVVEPSPPEQINDAPKKDAVTQVFQRRIGSHIKGKLGWLGGLVAH